MTSAAHNKLAFKDQLLFSMAEIANALGWRVQRVRRWVERERYPRVRSGRYYYISRDTIARMLGEDAHAAIARMEASRA